MKRRCSAPLVFALLAAVGVRAADRSATLLRAADRGRRMFVRNGTLPPKTGKNLRLIRGATAEGPTARP